MVRTVVWSVFILSVCLLVPRMGVRADEPKATAYKSLGELHADYSKRMRDLDRQRIKDLEALATKSLGEESDQAYQELFGLAISQNLYQDALAAGLKRAADKTAAMDERALAMLVAVIAKADQGHYEESLADMARFIQENSAQVDDPNRPKLEVPTAIALGEAYLQRLYSARRYDVARKLGTLLREKLKRPEIQAHFANRLARLELLGKPMMEIVGTDVDGKKIKLSDYKGKVILVNFWAAWCPPCVEEMPELHAFAVQHARDGFVKFGVNLDAQRQEVGSRTKAIPVVRQMLVKVQCTCPNVVAGSTGDDPAKTYGVTDIPANFLIGKDGTIVGFELTGDALRKAVEEELSK